MSGVETVWSRREKAEWNIADLGLIASTAEGITSAISDTRRAEHFSASELDLLIPIDLETPGTKPAHQVWADLQNSNYELNSYTSATEQLIHVFAAASDSVSPSRLPIEQRIQKNAQYMRAFQSGTQQYLQAQRYQTSARDWSEADTAVLLHRAKAHLEGHPRTEYELAIKAAGLECTLVRRTRRAGHRFAHLLRSART